jgi:hypothetical protein
MVDGTLPQQAEPARVSFSNFTGTGGFFSSKIEKAAKKAPPTREDIR